MVIHLIAVSEGAPVLPQPPQTQIHSPVPRAAVPLYLEGIGLEKQAQLKEKKCDEKSQKLINEAYIICPVKSSELQQKEQTAVKRGRFS